MLPVLEKTNNRPLITTYVLEAFSSYVSYRFFCSISLCTNLNAKSLPYLHCYHLLSLDSKQTLLFLWKQMQCIQILGPAWINVEVDPTLFCVKRSCVYPFIPCLHFKNLLLVFNPTFIQPQFILLFPAIRYYLLPFFSLLLQSSYSCFAYSEIFSGW